MLEETSEDPLSADEVRQLRVWSGICVSEGWVGVGGARSCRLVGICRTRAIGVVGLLTDLQHDVIAATSHVLEGFVHGMTGELGTCRTVVPSKI